MDMSKSRPAAGDLKIPGEATLLETTGFCNFVTGKRFDWLQAESTKTTPPYVRHTPPSSINGRVQRERGITPGTWQVFSIRTENLFY